MEVVIQRDQFIQDFEGYLKGFGFNQTDSGLELTRIMRQPGQTIIMNGQRMEQPGTQIPVKYKVSILGDGWVADEDETNKREFTQISLETLVGEELQGSLECAMYWDEPDEVKHIIKQIFKL